MQVSIANCNRSIYSYHSVARFGSALHQKHWHRKHLLWAPEQRRAPKAPFSASIYNTGISPDVTSLDSTGGAYKSRSQPTTSANKMAAEKAVWYLWAHSLARLDVSRVLLANQIAA